MRAAPSPASLWTAVLAIGGDKEVARRLGRAEIVKLLSHSDPAATARADFLASGGESAGWAAEDSQSLPPQPESARQARWQGRGEQGKD